MKGSYRYQQAIISSDAKSVIAIFFPFSEEVIARHRASHGTRHTQIISSSLRRLRRAWLMRLKLRILTTIYAEEFNLTPQAFKNDDEAQTDNLHYNVTWSSRHACYAAGLGTFEIHKHIITEKGCCGTIISLFAYCELEPAEHNYKGVYDCCIKCGACVRCCTVQAISIKYLRNSEFFANMPSIFAKNFIYI